MTSVGCFDIDESVNSTVRHDDNKGAYYLLHSNFRIFSRAIQSLSKLGSDLYLEPSTHGLSLKSFNKNKSVYGIFLFSNDFFSETDYSQMVETTSKNTLCRISMKCALHIFKGIQFMDKNFMSFKLWVDPTADTMIMEITHAFDLIRTLEINVLEHRPPFKTTVDKSGLPNVTVAPAEVFMSKLNLMGRESDELLIYANDEKFVFRNYCSKDDNQSIVKTEAHLRLQDLTNHQINSPGEITFCLKDFTALLSFAANYQCPVSLYFDTPGKPLVVALEGDVNFTSEFIVATFENSFAEAEESGQVEVRNVTQNRSERRESSACSHHQSLQEPNSIIRKEVTNNETLRLKNERTENDSSRNIQVARNPFPTPADSAIFANVVYEPEEKNQIVSDYQQPMEDMPDICEDLGFNFGTVHGEGANEEIRKSPSPKRRRTDKFRRFFLNYAEATQRSSQSIPDDSIMAYDSFDEG